MNWKDGLTAAVAVGLGYWGLTKVVKGPIYHAEYIMVKCDSCGKEKKKEETDYQLSRVSAFPSKRPAKGFRYCSPCDEHICDSCRTDGHKHFDRTGCESHDMISGRLARKWKKEIGERKAKKKAESFSADAEHFDDVAPLDGPCLHCGNDMFTEAHKSWFCDRESGGCGIVAHFVNPFEAESFSADARELYRTDPKELLKLARNEGLECSYCGGYDFHEPFAMPYSKAVGGATIYYPCSCGETQVVITDKRWGAESHAYSYAYNEGHSDSRKTGEYRPSLSTPKQEGDFKRILKQKGD